MQRLLANKAVLWSVALGLYQIARLRQSHKSIALKKHKLHRVVHVSPSYFSDRSYIGGGERYPTALAKTMANHVETVLVSFGDVRHSFMQGKCRVEIYPVTKISSNTVSFSFLQELVNADVVHCHQYRTIITNLAVLAGAALGKRVFVTDHGGWDYNFTHRLPLSNFIEKFLPVSAFSAQTLPSKSIVKVIYGGIDEKFTEIEINQKREKKVLFVGRILPHKGINYLIEAIDDNIQLDIIGRVYDETYFQLLKQLANNKKVTFMTSSNDSDILNAYSNATVTVLPSVYNDINGTQHSIPELLGLVLLESMACGTPVICTKVGGMPEIVEDGVTGFIINPNDTKELKDRINYLLNYTDVALTMGQKARQRVLQEYTWEAVVKKCLLAYSS